MYSKKEKILNTIREFAEKLSEKFNKDLGLIFFEKIVILKTKGGVV